MSRALILDIQNKVIGEFHGFISRNWSLAGVYGSTGGGSTSVVLPEEITDQRTWLQFGRMVYVEHADLPPWAGVIDTPWSAMPPVEMSIYNTPYLMNMRTVDYPMLYSGALRTIAQDIINFINSKGDLFLRLGSVDIDDTPREVSIQERPLWPQFNEMAAKAGANLIFRPVMQNGQLLIYVDLLKRAGLDTNYLLYDSADDNQEPNIRIERAVLDGEIINQVVGISSQDTAGSRLATAPFNDSSSIAEYRLRNNTVQFKGVSELSTLNLNAQTYLAYAKQPRLQLRLQVMDVNDTWRSALGLGNGVLIHAANLRLPRGRVGWRGVQSITNMAFDEVNNVVSIETEGAYDYNN